MSLRTTSRVTIGFPRTLKFTSGSGDSGFLVLESTSEIGVDAEVFFLLFFSFLEVEETAASSCLVPQVSLSSTPPPITFP